MVKAQDTRLISDGFIMFSSTCDGVKINDVMKISEGKLSMN